MPSNYPVATDDQASLHTAVNNFATILVSPANASQTLLDVASVSGLPSPGIISIDGEVIFYASTSVIGLSEQIVGCIRGADGTTATAHANNARVEARWVAEHHNVLVSAIIAIEQALGLNPQGTFTDVTQRLLNSTPEVVPFAVPTVTWSFTHDRRRLVAIQFYRRTGVSTYELFDANIEQIVNPTGLSNVTVTLPIAEEGALIYQ